MVHTFNPSTREAEPLVNLRLAWSIKWVLGQPRLCRDSNNNPSTNRKNVYKHIKHKNEHLVQTYTLFESTEIFYSSWKLLYVELYEENQFLKLKGAQSERKHAESRPVHKLPKTVAMLCAFKLTIQKRINLTQTSYF